MVGEINKGLDSSLDKGSNLYKASQDDIDTTKNSQDKAREITKMSETTNNVLVFLNDLKNPANIDDKTEDAIIDLFEGKTIPEINLFLKNLKGNQQFISDFSGLQTTENIISIVGKEIIGFNNSIIETPKSPQLNLSQFTPEYMDSLTTSQIKHYVMLLEEDVSQIKSQENPSRRVLRKFKKVILGLKLAEKDNIKQGEDQKQEKRKIINERKRKTDEKLDETIDGKRKTDEKLDKTIERKREIIKQKLDAIKGAIPENVARNFMTKITNNDGTKLDLWEAIQYGANEGNSKILEAILNELRNKDKLVSISRDLVKKGGGGKDNNEYQNFRNAITNAANQSGDNSFEALFDDVDKELELDKEVEEESGNIEVRIDKDGNRNLVSTSSKAFNKKEYSIKSPIDNQKMKQEKQSLESDEKIEVSPLDLSIKKIGQFISQIDGAKVSKENFSKFKQYILNSITTLSTEQKMSIKNSNSIEGLKNVLVAVKMKIEKDKKNVEKKHKKIMNEFQSKQDKEILKKEEKIKRIHKLLEKIGMTSYFDQVIIDSFIARVNGNPALYGFNRKINFSEGDLGITVVAGGGNLGLGIRDMVEFAKKFVASLGISNTDVFNPDNIGTSLPVILHPDAFNVYTEPFRRVGGDVTMAKNLAKYTADGGKKVKESNKKYSPTI